jgi:hypothetical protein
MDGNQAEGHLSFPCSKAMRSLSSSFAPSSVSAWIGTRSAVCPWLEWLVAAYPSCRSLLSNCTQPVDEADLLQSTSRLRRFWRLTRVCFGETYSLIWPERKAPVQRNLSAISAAVMGLLK